MKSTKYYLFFSSLLIIFLLSGLVSGAQDSNLPLSESGDKEEISSESESILLSAGEIDPHPSQSKTLQPATLAKDSTVQRTPVQKTKLTFEDVQEKPANETDDSILSFNFLYYIIQKFKMSDIVDQ